MNTTKIDKSKFPRDQSKIGSSSSPLPREIYFEFSGEQVRVADHIDGLDPEMKTIILYSLEADQLNPQVQIINSLCALGISLENPAVVEFCG